MASSIVVAVDGIGWTEVGVSDQGTTFLLLPLLDQQFNPKRNIHNSIPISILEHFCSLFKSSMQFLQVKSIRKGLFNVHILCNRRSGEGGGTNDDN